jgi:predicted transglutaminase-like cysteine proteinase
MSMRFWLLAILMGGIAYCVSEGANARSFPVKGATSYAQMVVHGAAEPPIGYSEFCLRAPGSCASKVEKASAIAMTTEKWQQLRDVNKYVNAHIKPMSDMDQYHVIEYWTYPETGKGDCEDYVLLKQRTLAERGWPLSDLLITVVRDENGEGHAVLTVHTTSGDYILDNKHSNIELWERTPYTYIKRQSSAEPMRWESLIPLKNSPTVAASSADGKR